jgi:hypothetical protein
MGPVPNLSGKALIDKFFQKEVIKMLRIFKRKRVLFRTTVIATMVAFLGSFNLSPMAFAGVKISAGTPVIVAVNTVITPEAVNIGDAVELSVVSDVVVDGKVVIKAGARASGEVTVAKKSNYIGIPAEIGICVRSVQAINETTVMLSGSKIVKGKDQMFTSIGLSLICCILFAGMKGGDASIVVGTPITCTVAVTTQ